MCVGGRFRSFPSAGRAGRDSGAGPWEPEALPAAPPAARRGSGCRAAAASPSPLGKLLVPVQERPAAGGRGGRAKNTAAGEPGPRGRAEGSGRDSGRPPAGGRGRRGRVLLHRFSPRPPVPAGPRGGGGGAERGGGSSSSPSRSPEGRRASGGTCRERPGGPGRAPSWGWAARGFPTAGCRSG